MGIEVTHQSENAFATQGQAWGDLNGDGTLDLILTSQLAPNRLFLGSGTTFELADWGPEMALNRVTSTGAVIVDVDNDTWPDVYLLARGANTLLRNTAGTGWDDVTDLSGLGDIGFGQTAAWGDYDGDGLLDVYVTNYELGQPDRLFHNDGGGAFSDTAEILSVATRTRLGFSATFFDYDLDQDLDLFVINDKFGGNVLWRNDGPGCEGWCWTDVSEETGAGVEMEGMGIALGDYDNDGDQDLFLTNIGPMVLLRNRAAQGGDGFDEVAEIAGALVDESAWGDYGWGAQFLDYDNDGWLDLYVAMGRLGPGPFRPNVLLRNRRDGTFERLPDAAGAEDDNTSQGLAIADYDEDGGVDLLVGNRGAPFALFRNVGADANAWIEVELRGDGFAVSTDAVGARLTLTDDRGVTQTREVVAGSSLGAGSSLRQHFGLADAAAVSLDVMWPDGHRDEFEGLALGELHRIDY